MYHRAEAGGNKNFEVDRGPLAKYDVGNNVKPQNGGTDMKVLRVKDVTERLGICRDTLWRLEKRGLFPRRIQLGRRAVGWLEEDIENWLLEKREKANK